MAQEPEAKAIDNADLKPLARDQDNFDLARSRTLNKLLIFHYVKPKGVAHPFMHDISVFLILHSPGSPRGPELQAF